MKIISFLLLMSCVNITLGDKDCYVKLYPEENFRGSTVRAVSDSTLIKGYSGSEELILALIVFFADLKPPDIETKPMHNMFY